jgi:hypothetical protein
MTNFRSIYRSPDAVVVFVLVMVLTLLIGFGDVQLVYESLVTNVRDSLNFVDRLKGSLEAFRWLH